VCFFDAVEYCLFLVQSRLAAATAGFMVGILMLVSWNIEIAVFCRNKRVLFGSGGLLLVRCADGEFYHCSAFQSVFTMFVANRLRFTTLAFVLRYFSVRQCIRFEALGVHKLGVGF
jgi:hypothetical protein